MGSWTSKAAGAQSTLAVLSMFRRWCYYAHRECSRLCTPRIALGLAHVRSSEFAAWVRAAPRLVGARFYQFVFMFVPCSASRVCCSRLVLRYVICCGLCVLVDQPSRRRAGFVGRLRHLCVPSPTPVHAASSSAGRTFVPVLCQIWSHVSYEDGRWHVHPEEGRCQGFAYVVRPPRPLFTRRQV